MGRIAPCAITALTVGCTLAACTSGGDGVPVSSVAGYVDDLEIASVGDAYSGASFGDAGVYQVITGIVHGKLDPRSPANAGIVDLERAPVGSDGYVTYSTDFIILRPKNAQAASKVLFYDVNNRGGNLALPFFDGAKSGFDKDQEGNGFLLRRGYTLVWSGWQGDIAQSGKGSPLGTAFPVAKNADGSSIVEMSRQEFVLDRTTNPVTLALSYPVANPDPAQATFNARASWQTPQGMTWDSPSQALSPSDWHYDGDKQIVLQRPSGTDAGTIFSLVYPAKDPIVMGVGFAAVRDLVSFLRYDKITAAGHPNPVADLAFDVAIGEGISQSGRFLRDFVWQGFNADARGRKVFDGLMPLIAGAKKAFINARWAQPGQTSREHEEHFQAGDQFPFAYGTSTDPLTGKTDGLFETCTKANTCPKTIQFDTSMEYWVARGSLNVTDGTGQDIAVPDNVRLYVEASTQHSGGGGVGTQTPLAACEYLSNPVNQSAVGRALVAHLEAWLLTGTAPPPSNYPNVQSGAIASPSARADVGFPDLSAVGLPYTGLYNRLNVTDYSKAIPAADLSKEYQVFVLKTDADGNDISGIRAPDVSVPLGTYLPWNIRKQGYAQGEMCSLSGGMLPFAITAEDRKSKGDPRPAILERYTDKADYVSRVHAAALQLVQQGFLLDEDVDTFTKKAESITVFP